MSIHPSAAIDPAAELDSSVQIDPYVVIEGPVRIGAHTHVRSHSVLSGQTTIGADNQIGPFASIGAPPQDLHYQGEPTEVRIGNSNLIREYVSIHRGTASGRGKTEIGNHCMIMASCHIAHDCRLGDHVIMANLATLAGHVELGDFANLGGMVVLHQHVRIGAYAFVGGMSAIGLDVPPYVILEGIRKRVRVSGLNKIGLRRAGMSRETLARLEEAFRILFRSPHLLWPEALEKLEKDLADCPEAQAMLTFCKASKRGVIRSGND